MSDLVGLREQSVRGAKSLAEAAANHKWRVPANYSAVWDCLDRHTDRLDSTCLHVLDDEGTEEKWTFRQMIEATNRFANALLHLGLGAGDVVAIHLGQRPETAIAYMAFCRLGIIGLPISKLFGPDAIKFRMAHSGAKAILIEPEALQKLDSIRNDLGDLRHIIVTAPAGHSELSFWPLLESGSAHIGRRSIGAEDPFLVMYTSGTTGEPKGVIHCNRVVLGLCGFDYSYNFVRDDDIYYSPADWAWAGGLFCGLLAPWAHGITVVAYRTNERFGPDATYRLLERTGATIGLYPPTALKILREMRDPREKYPAMKLRCIASGGEPVSPELARWVDCELKVDFNQGFGQTEATYVIGTCSALEPTELEPLGKPYPGHEISILDPRGVPVERGEAGEIAIRRTDPVVMQGYLNNPVAMSEKFVGDWMRTGDLGRLADSGYVYFEGRSDDIIKTSGYRVGPAEIEASIMEVEGVGACAVIGVPDKARGQAIKAFVKVLPGVAQSIQMKEQIQSYVKSRLAAHEYPREIEFVDEFPVTETGKIKRRALRERERSNAQMPNTE